MNTWTLVEIRQQWEDAEGGDGHLQAKEGPGADPSLTALRRSHFDCGLLVSRTVRQSISVVHATSPKLPSKSGIAGFNEQVLPQYLLVYV